MKKILFVLLILVLGTNSNTLYAQDENSSILVTTLGYMSSFDHQDGFEVKVDYEFRLPSKWMAIYTEYRYAELDNFWHNKAAYDIDTIRFDFAVGYRQYLTSPLSVFRPRIGVGAFVSLQNTLVKFLGDTLSDNQVGYGFEMDAACLFAYDLIIWGVGYKSTYLRMDSFASKVSLFENHFFVMFGFSF